MATNIPIVLEGSTLGERHQQYNAKVNEAFQKKVILQSVLQAEEKFPIDRLYKIDLASKHRNVEYILDNLKDDDMLYVSRALKSHWLLEPQYRDFINPRHLEEELFPHMIQPAVNKMRHWLQKNLTDNARCQEFYEYYKDRHEISIKFFWHCSSKYILIEMKNVIDKLSPQDLKVLCEACPQAAQVYFDSLQANKAALSRYIQNEEAYFRSIQCVLKMSSVLYLDIIEKYFCLHKFGPLSPEATRYIMKNHRDRFNVKPELYTGYVLHVNTLAGFLNSKEAMDLVLKLARAEDIISFYNIFQKVEPIIKRVNIKERAAFKKQVFVEKAYGEKLKSWPYPIPVPLQEEKVKVYSIFEDKVYDPRDYEENDYDCDFLLEACCPNSMFKVGYRAMNDDMNCGRICKTPLDILFDKYRFKGFEETYQDLHKKLRAESSVTGRMNMFLVLVSKSGGVPELASKLLKFLVSKHMNEPSNLRAAVVRSLVKRTAAWRLPEDTWESFLKFGHDLGLDGNDDDLVCIEGLHAVVLRHLLKNESLTHHVKTAFLSEPSTFKEYKLNSDEKQHIGIKLAMILLDSKPGTFLEMLDDYRLNVKNIPNAELTLIEKARGDEELLCELYKKKIGRRYILKESFALFNKEESFITALRHDTSVLKNGESFALLLKNERPNHDRFLTSLALYFNEPNGLAEQHRAKLIDAMKIYPQPWFARAINILSTNVPLSELIHEVDVIQKKEINKALAAAFKASTHKSRPLSHIKGVDAEWLGAKAIANKVLICREKDRESYIKSLLQWRRTARIALRLGLNSEFAAETFIAASKLRPAVALKIANKTYLRNKTIDPQIWAVTKVLIENIVSEKSSKFLLDQLQSNNNVPESIKAEYWKTLYQVLVKIDKKKVIPILCRLENIQTLVDQDFMKSVLVSYINDELALSKLTDDVVTIRDKYIHVRILAKYLLTPTSEMEQEERLKNTCDPFFEKIRILRQSIKDNNQFCNLYDILRKFVHALKYNKAFLGGYAPSYAVFERVLDNMKRVLPKEKYFALYLETHLIMLYYQSLQQSIEQKPEIFENLAQNLSEATETVGLQTGRNIGLEIKDITSEYYFSIIDIYKKVLVQYLDDFNFYYGENAILIPVFKGLLEVGRTQSLLLAEHVLKKRDFYLTQPMKDELMKDLKAFNNETVNFFLHAK